MDDDMMMAAMLLVLAMTPISDHFYYSGSQKCWPQPVLYAFVPNGSINSVVESSSNNLVFRSCNMELQTAHLLALSDF
jgi:hypothetical protein